MKFSTMLLPTGEFIILIGELTTPPSPGVLQALKDQTGAAGVFGTMDPVTGADALFDENARRHDPKTDPVNQILEQIQAGVEFTPAGLFDHRSVSEAVDDVLAEQPRTPQRHLEAGVEHDTGYVPTTRLTEPGQPGADPEPDVVVGADPDGEPELTVVHDTEPRLTTYDPEPGDRVRLHGTSMLGSIVDGLEGTVDDNPNAARGGFWVTTDDGLPYLMVANQMELIERG